MMQMNFDDTQIAFAHLSDAQLKKAHFLFSSIGNPSVTKLGIAATKIALQWKLPVKGLIKSTIFDHFCGGETLSEADITARKLSNYQIDVIMDYGVEGKSDEVEFEKTTENFLQTISFAANKPYIPFISMKITGFARFELLEKLHACAELTFDETNEAQRVLNRVDRICKAAHDAGKMILIDAEETWIQQPIDDLSDAMMAKYNQSRVVVFNTFQLYCHSRLNFLKQSHEKAKQAGYFLGAKLVRGAYMEKERERAIQKGYPSPIQATKEATDLDYDAATLYCLQHLDTIRVFIGTHNEKSCALATQFLQEKGIPFKNDSVFFSQLYGMSDNISFNLAKAGFQVSKYLPYGPVADVIPYLMRRAQENTSVSGQTGRELSLIKRELSRRKN